MIIYYYNLIKILKIRKQNLCMQNLFLIIFYLYFINQCYLIKKFHFLKGFYFQFLKRILNHFHFQKKLFQILIQKNLNCFIITNYLNLQNYFHLILNPIIYLFANFLHFHRHRNFLYHKHCIHLNYPTLQCDIN